MEGGRGGGGKEGWKEGGGMEGGRGGGGKEGWKEGGGMEGGMEGKFYVDHCLPFGLRSAPFLFNKFAQALEWILHNNCSVSKILHYSASSLVT